MGADLERGGEPLDTRAYFKAKAEAAKLDSKVVEASDGEIALNEVDQRAERLERSGVKEAITAADFDRIVKGQDIYPTFALKTMTRWLQRFREELAGTSRGHIPFCVLYGQKGRGKTLSGAWLLAQEPGVYITAPEFRTIMTSGHFSDAKRRDKVLRSRVTMVDDLGTEKNDEDAQTALYVFTNLRQGLHNGLSLLTANLALRVLDEQKRLVPEKGLLTRYDERTIDRLQHVGRFVEAAGEDLRGKLAL